MLTKRKSRIVTTILAVAILATMFAGFASATERENLANRAMFDYYSFCLSLPEYGVTDYATSRTKVVNLDYAYFDLTTVTNTTGYQCYLNVRSGDKKDIAGQWPEKLTNNDTGAKKVYYKTNFGYGKVGEEYRPSGQTDEASPKVAYIEGEWRP